MLCFFESKSLETSLAWAKFYIKNVLFISQQIQGIHENSIETFERQQQQQTNREKTKTRTNKQTKNKNKEKSLQLQYIYLLKFSLSHIKAVLRWKCWKTPSWIFYSSDWNSCVLYFQNCNHKRKYRANIFKTIFLFHFRGANTPLQLRVEKLGEYIKNNILV